MKRILLVCTTGLGNFINFTPCIYKLEKKYELSIIVDKRRGFYEEIKGWKEFKEVFRLDNYKKIPLECYSNIIFSIYSEYTSPSDFIDKVKDKAIFLKPKKNILNLPEYLINLKLLRLKSKQKPFFHIKKEDIKWAKDNFQEKFITLSPSSNNTVRWNKKRWDSKRWIKLNKILNEKEINSIFIGRKKDYPNDLLKSIKNNMLDIGLGKTAAIIKESKLLIGIDGGLTHLASAVGTSSIVLFGPANPKKDLPYFKSIPIIKKNTCKYAPCLKENNGISILDKCKRSKCMEAIQIEDVLNKITLQNQL